MPKIADKHTYCLYPDSMPEWGIASIVLAEDEAGLLFFPVRTICQGIGLDPSTQTGVVRGDSGLKAESRDIWLPSGRSRHEMLCLSKKGVAMWFARIQASRTGERVRERLQQYQDDLWALATRLLFSRKRIAEAGIEDAGEIVQVTGTERLEIDCECGQRHILEKHNGIWRHFVMSPESEA